MRPEHLLLRFPACMLRQALPIILFILILPGAAAQSWQWAVTAGGIESDKATDMDMDIFGNLYICGYYNEYAYFGPHVAPVTFGKDGFLAKLDTAGNFTWLSTADGGWDERVLGMCTDSMGFVYATGCCWNSTNFGSCLQSGWGSSDEIFVAKFDLNGNCQWLTRAGGGSDDHGFDLVVDKQGNIYLTGFITDEYMSGTSAQFGSITVPIPFGDSIAFVSKMDPSGNFLWVRTFPGTDGERDNRIAIDSLDNVYIAGGFTGTATFGPATTLTSAGGRDIFVTKYDKNGNFVLAMRAGSTLDDRANSIHVDHFGDVYVTGEFRDKAVFGTDTINNHGGPNGRDIFVAKMKQDGTWVWAKKAGSNKGGDRGNRIIANKRGHLFVTGQFNGEAEFGNNITLTTTDSLQAFVACIDTAGKWKWALQGGGAYEDRGNGLACDDSCNVYNTGYYQLQGFFGDYSFSASGRKDVYVAKIVNACPVTPLDTTSTPLPVPAECGVWVANVFSPNGDGINDVLGIEGYCIEKMSFSVYNRWGRSYFTSSDPAKKWDGKISGKDAEPGVYYYVGEATLTGGEVIPLRGFITLLR